MKEKRIKFELPLPSVSFKKFIEKAVAEDDFFSLALENPLGAMKECGINLDSSFLPTDFATFFGALAGLREVVKEKKLKDLTFEKIFGQAAIIRGAILDAEITRGFFREWDNRDAFSQRMQFVSTEQKFEVARERIGNSLKNALLEREIDLRSARTLDIQRDWVSQKFESSETDNHTKTDWSNPNDMQRNSHSDRGVNQNFEKSGIRSIFDLMRGPLINPVDLAAISARIELYAQVLKETDL